MMILNQNGGSKTDVLVKLILVFFVSLLSFSIGTFVGKQFSDSQHRLASLEQDYRSESEEVRAIASIPEADLEVEPSEILSKEDISKLAEEFVQETTPTAKRNVATSDPTPTPEEERSPDATNETSPAEPEVQLRPISKPSRDTVPNQPLDVQKAADAIASNHPVLKPVAVQKTEPAQAKSLPKITANDVQGKYTIQVSSHTSEKDAQAHAEDLISKGFSAFYIPALVDGKTWYRVSVGNFASSGTAKEYLQKVKTNVAFKDAIVRRVVQ